MADTPLTNRQIIQKPDIVINPNFPVPPGLADVRQGTDTLPGGGDAAGTPAGRTPGDTPIDILPPGADGGVPVTAPSNISIVSQTLRFNPDGTYVVDVVLAFDDVPGAERYEVRLTKEDGSPV